MPDGDSNFGVLHIVNKVLYPVPVGTVLETIRPRNDTDKVLALLGNTSLPEQLRGLLTNITLVQVNFKLKEN